MVDIAMASDGSGGGFASFIPLIIIFSIWGFFNASIAGRKGKNKILYFILSIIPAIALFVSLYLVSLTDKSILDRIEKLES